MSIRPVTLAAALVLTAMIGSAASAQVTQSTRSMDAPTAVLPSDAFAPAAFGSA